MTGRTPAIRRVLVITLAGNLAVVGIKLAAGLAAGALSVVADAAHSAVDALNNVIALTLATVAARAPDEEHPYGHAKFEALGTLAVVAFLSITVYELASSAIARLALGQARPRVTPWVVGAMIVSAFANFLIARYEERRGRELDSALLIADASHTRSDMYASLTVIVGLLVVALGYPAADAAFTLVVAIVIARAGWRILLGSVPVLVDERAVAGETIRRIALESPGVRDCFDVRSRGRAGAVFAELTITVEPGLNVEQAHQIADEVERRVARELGARDVVAHVEPDRRPL